MSEGTSRKAHDYESRKRDMPQGWPVRCTVCLIVDWSTLRRRRCRFCARPVEALKAGE